MSDEEQMVDAVKRSLIRLRGDHGRLTVHKFARHPLLVQLLGDGDLMDGFIALIRELDRLKRGNKYEAAVAWSITADADAVIDRLQMTVDALAVGEGKDQRTGRHWSDRGMDSVARDLVAFAAMRGHTGRDLIGIAVNGGSKRLVVQIVQVASVNLVRRAPLVTIQVTPDRADAKASEVDLETVVPDVREIDGDFETRRHVVRVDLPDYVYQPGERLLSISLTARRTPTPIFLLENHSEVDPTHRLTFAVNRTLVVTELTAFE
ncbi:hypothetical protein D4768_21380 [Rhodococcus erythropolis]|uniref:hypothetical protein n=1 Tax=Rhodococcus erythropolis TaxID=1833 RepID=UPI001F26EF87|nr:hypothetical protein [Rhodococcus erythropolis]UJC79946.1 hypothetical protein D4768_21380 [Rhodococcus erythropolis]